MTGRNAIKKLLNLWDNSERRSPMSRKSRPAIAAILNVVAQALTWGAKALEFLSKNLWIVALFLTYLLYDTVKERMKKK